MSGMGSSAWDYKIVIRRPDETITLDHRLTSTPLPQLLDSLRSEGWSLVHESEARGPFGVQVTYVLRRPASVGREPASRSSS